jgi:hypothetical protein
MYLVEETIESVLLQLLKSTDDSIVIDTMNLIPILLQRDIADEDNNFRTNFIQLGGIIQLKQHIASKNNKIKMKAIHTISVLLTTETSISDFLGMNSDNLERSSLSDLLPMLNDINQAKIILQFILKLCKKWESDNVKFSQEFTKENMLTIYPQSLRVDCQMDPIWIDTTKMRAISNVEFNLYSRDIAISPSKSFSMSKSLSRLPSTDARTQKRKALDIKRELFMKREKTACLYSLSFWILPTGFIGAGGVPLFYRGPFTGKLVNNTKKKVTVRNHVLIRDEKVYFEVKLNSSDVDCQVSLILISIYLV